MSRLAYSPVIKIILVLLLLNAFPFSASDSVIPIRFGPPGKENLVDLLHLTIKSYEEPVDAIFKFLKDKNVTVKEKFMVLSYVCASTFDSYEYEVNCMRKLPLVANVTIENLSWVTPEKDSRVLQNFGDLDFKVYGFEDLAVRIRHELNRQHLDTNLEHGLVVKLCNAVHTIPGIKPWCEAKLPKYLEDKESEESQRIKPGWNNMSANSVCLKYVSSIYGLDDDIDGIDELVHIFSQAQNMEIKLQDEDWSGFWEFRKMSSRMLHLNEKGTGHFVDVSMSRGKISKEFIDFNEMDTEHAAWWFGFTGRHVTAKGFPAEIELSHSVSTYFTKKFLKYSASNVGLSAKNKNKHVCNMVSCRHVLMLTLLYDTLLSRGYSASEFSRLDILEIGGGYGNQLHMILQAIGFKSYTTFDMAYVQDFQKFFISKNNEVELNKNISFERFSSHEEHQNILGQNDILFVDEKSFLRWKYFAKHPSQYNVLIATHSLSELPMEDFLKYYLGLLDDDNLMVEWILYSTSIFDPSLSEAKEKFNILLKKYEIVRRLYTEGYSVGHFILHRKRLN